MIKSNFTITPEQGSNNGLINIKANANNNFVEATTTINVQGGGISKSVNLIQKAKLKDYTSWAKSVDSKWDLTGDFVFPDVYYNKGTTSNPIKFLVETAWIYDGTEAYDNPSESPMLIDLANMGQVDRTVATNKTYNYYINNKLIKTNGCQVYSVVCSYNLTLSDYVILETKDGSNPELHINNINVRVATGSPNFDELQKYLQDLGWDIDMIENNQNNRIEIIPKEQAGRVPLYIKMIRDADAYPVSDCCNLVIA